MSTKSPTIKRILKEAAELSTSPSLDYTAAPLETNLYEWHFTLRGPPPPSPFAAGIYHGRIILPPAYPLRPPSFRFLTPSGRFEANREICLSISGFHEESWQPAWGIRTALVAIRAFMAEDAKGQVGGMSSEEGVRRRLAKESLAWRCGVCGSGSCEEIMKGLEERVRGEMTAGEEMGGPAGSGEVESVPEGLRLGYKDELGKAGKEDKAATNAGQTAPEQASSPTATASDVPRPHRAPAHTAPAPQQGDATPATQALQSRPPPQQPLQTPPQQQRQQQQQRPAVADVALPQWIDKAIIGLIAALVFMLLRKMAAS